MEIRVDKGLVKALKEAQRTSEIQKVVLRNGAEMQEKAMRMAPVKTGHLMRSIGLSSDRADGGLSAKVAPNADYASYVEYGTRYMGAQPFIRPSFNQQKKKFESEMKRLMK